MLAPGVSDTALAQARPIASPGPFRGKSADEWTRYLELFNNFYDLNSLPIDKKKQWLCAIVGQDFYGFISELILPQLVQDLTFDQLVVKVGDALQLSYRPVIQRAQFGDRFRREGESVMAYVNELRRLARHCDFTGGSFDDAIRDQLIRGIGNRSARVILLREKDITLQRAIDLAVSVETSEAGADCIAGPSSASLLVDKPLSLDSVPSPVIYQLQETTVQSKPKRGFNQRNAVQYTRSSNTGQSSAGVMSRLAPRGNNFRRPSPGGSRCWRCGGDHWGVECRFVNAKCFKCGRIGHIASVCLQPDNVNLGDIVNNPPYQVNQRYQRDQLQQQYQRNPQQQQLRRRQQRPNESSWNPKQRKVPLNVLKVTESIYDDDGGLDNFDNHPVFMLTTTVNQNVPYFIRVKLANQEHLMQLDTGAEVSVISERTYEQLWPTDGLGPTLHKVNFGLKGYQDLKITVKGHIVVELELTGQKQLVNLVVVSGSGVSLLGRDILYQFKLDLFGEWVSSQTLGLADGRLLQVVTESKSLNALLDHYAEVFKTGLGQFKGPPIDLFLDPSVQPKFFRHRPVPLALRGKVEAELLKLQQQGILVPILYSHWATPIVTVLKKNGEIRICGDYRSTVNQAIQQDPYPLPRIEEIFAGLSNCTIFSKLDMSQAYQQLRLTEDASKVVAINTHKGLFAVTRLPFGIAPAVGIFQRIVDSLFKGVTGVFTYLDDILVASVTEAEHLQTLQFVLGRLEEFGLRLCKSKCEFCKSELDYLGFRISRRGLLPLKSKIEAIVRMPPPKNVLELKSFLGMVGFYSSFLPDLSTILAPVYVLLRDGTSWNWSDDCQKSFEQVKSLLSSAEVLIYYDPLRPLVLSCDASPYGLGAVLAHHDIDGRERPIAYASRLLTSAEKNYAQIDREALSIVFGVRKFHNYIFGRKFTIITDHKPLLGLFDQSKPIPSSVSQRRVRWLLMLSNYMFKIIHRRGALHGSADGLSRLPVDDPKEEIDQEPFKIVLMFELSDKLVKFSDVIELTAKDPILMKVATNIKEQWINFDGDQELQVYYKKRDELSFEDGAIYLNSKLVIPQAIRAVILRALHEGHPGVVMMKSRARSLFFWPGMNSDIAALVHTCLRCQVNAKSTPREKPIPWPESTGPWMRIHIDHAGPFRGFYFLIVVDAFSGWLEVAQVNRLDSSSTIRVLRRLFATHGLPSLLVSDNGTAFTSVEFKSFLDRNGISHLFSPPYHPQSNGRAERAVQYFKDKFVKLQSGEMELKLARLLFQQHLMPSGKRQLSPAELLMGRKLNDQFQLTHNRNKVKFNNDLVFNNVKQFQIGSNVWVKNLLSGDKWLPAVVVKRNGFVLYNVRLVNGTIITRHINHMRRRFVNKDQQLTLDQLLMLGKKPHEVRSLGINPCVEGDDVKLRLDLDRLVQRSLTPVKTTYQARQDQGVSPEGFKQDRVEVSSVEVPRRSSRTRKPVDRYQASN